MNESQPHPRPNRLKQLRAWLFSWRTIRRALVTLAALITLLATFYTIENWRGQRAWEERKHDLIAAGYEMDWNKLIPPAIPDEQNIFKAPHMQEWFVRQGFSVTGQNDQPPTNFLSTLKHPSQHLFGKESHITNTTTATDFLAWSEQFETEFTQIHVALQRPYARIGGDYTRPYEILIPNMVALRNLAQTFAQRAHCHLLLNQPAAALNDLTFIHAMRKLLLGQPTGKPMTLVAAMIHVAITGLYTSIIEEGLQLHAWQEPQLFALESQLAELNLPGPVYEGLRCELTATSHTFEHEPFDKLLALSSVVTKASQASPQKSLLGSWRDWSKGLKLKAYNLAPRGWLFQNLAVCTSLERMVLESVRGCQTNIHPKEIKTALDKLQTELERTSLFNLIAKVAIPNFYKALQTTARNQTSVNQARIACALERYHQAHRQYPDSLAALRPQFLATIPNDLIGNQPLKYRHEADGGFTLYSVGWNETDDDGKAAPNLENGDWIWRSSAP
ncbi:MAG: hypothetical protein QM813_15525 [Verrucomicrobiota bacterium]